MDESGEARYSEWLVKEGVSDSHLQAHQFARRLFENNGGLSTEAMRAYLQNEEEQGSNPARQRNLVAAARYIAKFESEIENEELAIDLDRPSLDEARGQWNEQPLLDLGLDEVEPRTNTQQTVTTASDIQSKVQKNSACSCASEPTPAFVTSGIVFAGPSAFAAYIALRLYAGKTFAVMAQWGGGALLALVALFLLRIKCDTCETTLDNDDLDPGSKKTLLLIRLALVGMVLLMGYFSKEKYNVWAEERRIGNLSGEELEEEWQRDDRKNAEEEVGHTMSDSEYLEYLREEEAVEIEELEELLGRPLTQEELDEEGFGEL